MSMKRVTSVILGGGRGTRLFPLTLERAKPSVSFAGKYRFIDIPISNCINSEIKRVFVLTQFMSASLHRHIMQTYRFDHFTNGFVDVLAAEQTPQGESWFQGTADAVRATLLHTTYYKSDQILILSGDHLYRMDYKKLVEYHRAKKADITICVNPVPREEAPRMGVMKVNEENRVTEFVEKPSDPAVLDRFVAPEGLFGDSGAQEDQYLGSMGIYVFETELMIKLLEDKTQTDFGKHIIPAAIDNHNVVAYPFDGYWKDIGTIDAFYDANIELAQPKTPFRLYRPGWPFYSHARSLPPSRVVESQVQDSLIAEGAEISGANISDSVIGVRSRIRDGSVLNGVVMLGADFYEGEEVLGKHLYHIPGIPKMGIGRNCKLDRVIIDKNARIGDGVEITSKEGCDDFQGEFCWVRDGVTVIPKGAVIPEGTKL
jgi:glucose-1-phosphate adenylyltransferase